MTLIGLAILVEFHLDETTLPNLTCESPPHDTGVFWFLCVSSFLGRMLVPLCWLNRDFWFDILNFWKYIARTLE